ncbi:hypothetical protein PABG_11341 [Paracoccidioides brasiliensis Pb03]|nr:hypothetical protein PABG_11341 [Paracoccidioides brasiliensis Pb03]
MQTTALSFVSLQGCPCVILERREGKAAKQFVREKSLKADLRFGFNGKSLAIVNPATTRMLEANLELPVDGICSLTVPYISVCNLRSDIRHGLITEAWNQAELPTRRNVTLPKYDLKCPSLI